MLDIYKQFCKIGFNKKGVLNYFEPVYPEDFNFAYDCVDKIAELEPDKTALVWCNVAGEERTFTFREMRDLSNKTANYLKSLGLKKGDAVMLILKRNYQYWYTVLALHRLGIIAIPATNQLTAKDVIYRVNAASVRAVICSAECDIAEHVEQSESQCETLEFKLLARGTREGWIDFDAMVDASPDTPLPRVTKATDPMLMYFTSGTTGYPKMALHDFTYPIGHIITAKFWQNLHENSLHLTVAETGWAKASWGKIYGQWFAGAAVFVYDFDRFVPEDLLETIKRHKVTSFCAPPTIFRFFIKAGIEGGYLDSLEYATIAGEALNPEVFNKFKEFTGLSLMEGFGQSESTMMLGNLAGTTPKPGSMGKPSPLYRISLVDDEGNEVPPGEVGEIVVKVDDRKQVGLFIGYYRNQEKTDEVWHDGYYHTGDTAWRDEEGYFWYVGRKDDIIKSSGYRIGPFEIESVLLEHPAVMDCAITGAPHPVRGQVVKATIVLTSGYEPSEELVKELQTHVKNLTAPYKYPRIIEFVDELPKTISGKIRRVAIREKKDQ